MSIVNNILSWIIFGSVIGGIVYIFEPYSMRGKDPLLLGIAGAMIAGLLANFLLNIPIDQFSLTSFMVALCGSCFLVLGVKTLRNI
jgi:uncharacterized membrane protein YeaQ/YmgE (transglycosylase-associated protein family)